MWAPFVLSFSVEISGGGTSFGKMLIADENAVRFTREFAAVRVPISPLRSNSQSKFSCFRKLFACLSEYKKKNEKKNESYENKHIN